MTVLVLGHREHGWQARWIVVVKVSMLSRLAEDLCNKTTAEVTAQ